MSTQIPKSHRKALQPYVAEDETALRTTSSPDRTYLLTDKRLIRFWQGQEQDSGRARQEVKTIRLDEVSKTTVNVRGREPIDYEKLTLAAVTAFAGVLAVYGWDVVSQESVGFALLLAGMGLLAVAVGIAANAYDRDPPYVRLKLGLVGSREESFSFTKGDIDFCEAVSEAVGRQ